MYREAVAVMMDSLNKHTRVPGGFASIHSVLSMEQVESATALYREVRVDYTLQTVVAFSQVLEAHIQGLQLTAQSFPSQEDHMPSYFLAETCKYAFLTADNTFWKVSAFFGSCTLCTRHQKIPQPGSYS